MNKTILLTLAATVLFCVSVSAESYDLDSFLSLVEQHSNELKIAQKDLELAGAEKRAAVSGALPKIAAEGNYNRNLADAYMYVDLGDGTRKMDINRNNEYAASVVLSQTLLNPAVYQGIKAAKQYQTLSDFVYQASHLEIMTYAKKAFYQTLLLYNVWEVTAASEVNARDNYLQVKNSFDNGLVSEFDLLRAEARWRDVIPQTTEAGRNFQLATIGLKNLAGLPLDGDLALDGDLTMYPPLPQKDDLTAILRRRPDFNALVWEEKLRETNVSAERAGYFPSLNANMVYSFSSQSDEWRFDDRNNNVFVGVTLSIPIFTGGHTRSQVQKARLELDQTRIRLDQAQEMIYQELESVHLRLDEAFNRIIAAEATLNAAEKAFQIAEISARNGLATQLELKDARVMYDQAQMNRYAAMFEYLAAYFDWEKAVGGV